MFNDYKKKLIEIILTLCALFLALIFAISSFAWMSTRKNVKVGGTSALLKKNTDLGIHDIKIYKRFGADEAKDVSSDGEIVLTEYDTVFTDKNVNTSIILRLELFDLPYQDGKYQPFHLRVRCTGADSYLISKEDYNYDTDSENESAWINDGAILPDEFWHEENVISGVLSNIIGIRCNIGDNTLNSYTKPDEIYSGAKTYLASTTEQTFIDTVDGSTKKGILTFNFSNYDEFVDNGKVIVYIDVNYNDKLIEFYSSQHDLISESGEQSDSGVESIKFNSDLTNCFIFLEGI